jgi:hypothetical protein
MSTRLFTGLRDAVAVGGLVLLGQGCGGSSNTPGGGGDSGADARTGAPHDSGARADSGRPVDSSFHADVAPGDAQAGGDSGVKPDGSVSGGMDAGSDAETLDSGAKCIIGGTTYSSGAANPTNACESCQPATSTTTWTVVADAGVQCGVVDCGDAGTTTELHGTVYAPNGTLPLWNVNVYVPGGDPGIITPGLNATCDTCSAPLPGAPITATTSKEDGTFVLTNVPVVDNLPVVIQIGKWRKQLKLQTRPTACAPNGLPVVDTTLPKSRQDISGDVVSVDLPQIAVSTGEADAIECLLRKVGIADVEFTTDAQGGRVNLFADTLSTGEGSAAFAAGFAGGSGSFADSQTLWDTYAKLSTYDITMLSCEGAQNAETKSQAAMDAMKMYADMGGRILMTHWQNIWIEGSTQLPADTQEPAVWPTIAAWTDDDVALGNNVVDVIDEVNDPSGPSFATWMLDNAGSTVRDDVPLANGTAKQTCESVDDSKA